MKDYYNKIFDIVEKRGDERIRRRKAAISRYTHNVLMVAGLCAAIAMFFGIWHSSNIKSSISRGNNDSMIITESAAKTTAAALAETTIPLVTSTAAKHTVPAGITTASADAETTDPAVTLTSEAVTSTSASSRTTYISATSTSAENTTSVSITTISTTAATSTSTKTTTSKNTGMTDHIVILTVTSTVPDVTTPTVTTTTLLPEIIPVTTSKTTEEYFPEITLPEVTVSATDTTVICDKFSEISLNGTRYSLLEADVDSSVISKWKMSKTIQKADYAEKVMYVATATIYETNMETSGDVIAVKFSGSDTIYLYSAPSDKSLSMEFQNCVLVTKKKRNDKTPLRNYSITPACLPCPAPKSAFG